MLRRLAIFLLTLFIGFASTAQEPLGSQNIFSAELLGNDNRIPVGEYSNLVFKFAGGDIDLPNQIEADGLEILQSRKQQHSLNINGVKTFVTTHFYTVRGTELGTFIIPAVEVPLKDATLKSEAIQVTIYERDNSDTANSARTEFGKLELEKAEFYVNEIVPFTMTGYVRGRNSINDVVRAQLEHESFIFKGFRNVRTSASEIGNTLFSEAALPSTFFALKPGEHRLGPGTIAVRVVESGGGRGLSAFFTRTSLKELATNTVTTTVKPLPGGAPRSFTGGVGNFMIKMIPSTKELNLGDPISIDFEVTGVGNLRTMSAPVFSVSDKNWKTFTPAKTLNEEQDSDGIEPGTVTFSQVIIPEFEAAEIPPFELTYFNPISAEYVTLKTDSIPISVTKDGSSYEALEQPLNVSNGGSERETAAAQPDPKFEDMMHIRLNAPRWLAEISPDNPGVFYISMQILFSVSFCTILGFGLFRWLRQLKHQQNHPKTSTTFRQSLKRIPKDGAPKKEFYHAVSTSLTLWKDENSEASDKAPEVVDNLLKRCEDLLYSGEFTSDAPIAKNEASEIHSILRKLQR